MTLVRPKPRRCRWPCFARTITGRRRSSGARCRSVECDRTKMFRPAALLPADHCSRDSTGQPAPGALKAFMLLTEAPAGSSTRCPPNLNCHNHNQHAGRPCFSLAFLIGRTKSTLNYAILQFFAHEHFLSLCADCGQSPPVDAHAVCILQAGSMHSQRIRHVAVACSSSGS